MGAILRHVVGKWNKPDHSKMRSVKNIQLNRSWSLQQLITIWSGNKREETSSLLRYGMKTAAHSILLKLKLTWTSKRPSVPQFVALNSAKEPIRGLFWKAQDFSSRMRRLSISMATSCIHMIILMRVSIQSLRDHIYKSSFQPAIQGLQYRSTDVEFKSVIGSGLEFVRIYILVKSIFPWRRFRTNSKSINRELALCRQVCRFELEKLKPKYWTMIYRKQNNQNYSAKNVSSQSVSMVNVYRMKNKQRFKKVTWKYSQISLTLVSMRTNFLLWRRSPKIFLAIFTFVQFCINLRIGSINSRLRCSIPFVPWRWPKGTRPRGREWNR